VVESRGGIGEHNKSFILSLEPEFFGPLETAWRGLDSRGLGLSLSRKETSGSLLFGLRFFSYLVDPASNICLSQRLSHACLSINDFIL
jgi:hypothetical protein